jgi:hypothetical protein
VRFKAAALAAAAFLHWLAGDPPRTAGPKAFDSNGPVSRTGPRRGLWSRLGDAETA